MKRLWSNIRKMLPVLLAISLSLNILCSCYFIPKIIHKIQYVAGGGVENPKYCAQLSQFEQNTKDTECDVLFLGDSITANGMWNEWIPDKKVLNRGIGSDTTEGVKSRLHEVESRNPKKIFLMIGINDLGNGVDSKEIIDNVDEILKSLSSDISSKIYLQSILPCKSVDNSIISAVNTEFCKLSLSYENVTFVNLHRLFLKDGEFDNRLFSTDGTHLNGLGYQVWIDAIGQYL